MHVLSLCMLLGLAVGAPLQPTRMRCDGSAFGSEFNPSTSFAVRHDRRVRFTWEPLSNVNTGASQAGYRVVVRSDGKQVWDSGMVQSAIPEAVYIGSSLKPGTLYTWEVSWADETGALSAPATSSFRTGLADANWTGVNWIGSNTTNLYRAEFTAPTFTNAVLYLAGLGYSYTTVNGVNVSSSHLVSAPWTQNERLVMYSTYDVTALLKQNTANSIGVALGYGWRDSRTFTRREDTAGDSTDRVLRAILQVTAANGTQTILTTSSAGWTTAAGPVVADNVYNGETYDARKEMPGWDLVGFQGNWTAVETGVLLPPRGPMVPWSAPHVAVSRIVKPINVTTPKPGIQIFDFGVNQAGVVMVTGINLPAGKSMTLRHAEIMQHPGIPGNTYEPGMIYTGNLRGAKATDVYISNGKVGKFFPKFTYHGFRFVEVTGVALEMNQIEMHHFHSAIPLKTVVKFSSPLLNSMQQLALGAQRSNFMSVLTDCDQRDERLGWMGDADLSSNSIALNYDATSFLKFCTDIQATEVDSDGSLPDVVPYYRYGGRPADVSWSAAYPQVQYVNWKMNNDIEGIKENLHLMVLHQKNVAGQAANGLGNMHTPYGDWVPPPATKGNPGTAVKPSAPYTSAFSYIVITQIVGEMAAAVGNTTVAQYMAGQVTELKKEFNNVFFKNGKYDLNIQTNNALALALGEGMNTTVAASELYNSVVAKAHHFDTGIIGFKFMFDGLHDNGHASDALAVLEATDYPSVGYMLTNPLEDATQNLWELIDGPFEGPGMNSRNHHMWSSYSAYLVKRLAGVDLNNKVLSPSIDVDLSSSEIEMQLSNGVLKYSWAKEGGLQCGKGYKGNVNDGNANKAEVSCGGGVVTDVVFASYGEPTGTVCGGYKESAMCHHPESLNVAKKACLGLKSCSIDLSVFDVNVLPSTCSPHFKYTVQCSNVPVTRVDVEIPIGAAFSLRTSNRSISLLDGVLLQADGELLRLPSGGSSYILR